MVEEKELTSGEDENIFHNVSHLTSSDSSKLLMDNTNKMPLSSATTATLLQAYAARLSSDSDYAR